MKEATLDKQNAANKKETSQSGHPITDKVKDGLHNTVDTIAEKAGSTESNLRDTAERGSANLSAKQKEYQDKWEQSSVKQYATENPIATAGIAFAAGVLLTSLLRRK